MTTDATIRPMPRPRGTLSEEQAADLDHAKGRMYAAEAEYRNVVLDALEDGGSFSAVAEATGLSTNTLQRWKKEATTWPRNMERERWKREAGK